MEFFIDLVHGTRPMLMALYRMSALEFSEMKNHLEEFLEKKFSRSGVSLWGALEHQCC